MSLVKESFRKTKDGREATLFTVLNKNGVQMKVTNYGASLVALFVPDKAGNFADVVLGYDDVTGYETNAPFFGNTIGRSSNRIANARFEIDGVPYQLPTNENMNNLHSCPEGYNFRLWEQKAVEEGNNAVTFSLFSPHMDQGFPGNFQVDVTYSLSDDNEVKIHYHGFCDKKTVINLTNHSYFNLAGHDAGSIMEHEVLIHADGYVPVKDKTAIPTGKVESVVGTPMDFTSAKRVGDEIDNDFSQLKFTGGYDHNYALRTTGEAVELIAEVFDRKSGRKMQVFTDLPGVQFYTGNCIGNVKGKGGAEYGKREGLCLETQYFPDSVNQMEFKSPVFGANEVYDTTTIYKFL